MTGPTLGSESQKRRRTGFERQTGGTLPWCSEPFPFFDLNPQKATYLDYIGQTAAGSPALSLSFNTVPSAFTEGRYKKQPQEGHGCPCCKQQWKALSNMLLRVSVRTACLDVALEQSISLKKPFFSSHIVQIMSSNLFLFLPWLLRSSERNLMFHWL